MGQRMLRFFLDRECSALAASANCGRVCSEPIKQMVQQEDMLPSMVEAILTVKADEA